MRRESFWFGSSFTIQRRRWQTKTGSPCFEESAFDGNERSVDRKRRVSYHICYLKNFINIYTVGNSYYKLTTSFISNIRFQTRDTYAHCESLTKMSNDITELFIQNGMLFVKRDCACGWLIQINTKN